MFKFLFVNGPYRPEPHNPVVDRVVADFLFDNKRIPKLREIHSRVPKKYWGYYTDALKPNQSYIWKNNSWKPVEKTELPLFEIIKHGIEL